MTEVPIIKVNFYLFLPDLNFFHHIMGASITYTYMMDIYTTV